MERLRHPRDIARARRRRVGQRRGLTLAARDRADGGPPRVAVVATRDLARAVDRNRAKRRLRAAARVVGLPPGYDLVLLARPASAKVSFVDLVDDLDAMLVPLRPATKVTDE